MRPGTTGNSRKVMIRSLAESLRRLQTDYVDVFMPHLPDGITPTEEILSGFEDLRRAGKIRYGGFSNSPPGESRAPPSAHGQTTGSMGSVARAWWPGPRPNTASRGVRPGVSCSPWHRPMGGSVRSSTPRWQVAC